MRARTQSSVALRGHDGEWVLLNASPDLRYQILQSPFLAPRSGRGERDSPIAAVVLTNADADHIAGLVSLRERARLRVYAATPVLEAIAANPLFAVLADDIVERKRIDLDESFEPIAGVRMSLFAVPGKTPLWNERGLVGAAAGEAQTVGVSFGEGEGTAFYIPGCADIPPQLAERLRGAGVVLFDGTLFEDDEMIRMGVGSKTGRRMGHMPVNGEGGSLEAFKDLAVKRKVYIHINNTNPILIDGSRERAMIESHGWEVAEDGMDIALWKR